jgi:hypothetical protein
MEWIADTAMILFALPPARDGVVVASSVVRECVPCACVRVFLADAHAGARPLMQAQHGCHGWVGGKACSHYLRPFDVLEMSVFIFHAASCRPQFTQGDARCGDTQHPCPTGVCSVCVSC